MEARFKIFKSATSPWPAIFATAARFATSLGPERLIGISHSCDQNVAVVTVWYWAFATDEWDQTEVRC